MTMSDATTAVRVIGAIASVLVVVVVVVYLHDNSVQNSRKTSDMSSKTGSSREVIKKLIN